MNQDATWYEGRPRPRPHCVTLGPSSCTRGTEPQFSAHVYCGQTVAHLSYCWALVIITNGFVAVLFNNKYTIPILPYIHNFRAESQSTLSSPFVCPTNLSQSTHTSVPDSNYHQPRLLLFLLYQSLNIFEATFGDSPTGQGKTALCKIYEELECYILHADFHGFTRHYVRQISKQWIDIR